MSLREQRDESAPSTATLVSARRYHFGPVKLYQGRHNPYTHMHTLCTRSASGNSEAH